MTQTGIQGSHNSAKFETLTTEIGQTPITFENGRIAKQAGGAVIVRQGDTMVMVTVCASKNPKVGMDFFPLTCEYIEKFYASGRIPGGFFKREARPSSNETINARIIDRSIRPLFPEGFRNEVQVIATVISHDGVHDSDALALSGASMALHISEIPFAEEGGPIAGVRVGRLDGKLLVNPTIEQRKEADLDMFVAVSKDAIVMVEGGANEVPETEMIDALFFAHEEGQKVIKSIEDMRTSMGKEKMKVVLPERNEDLFAQVKGWLGDNGLSDALKLKDKGDRYAAMDDVKEKMIAYFTEAKGEEVFAAESALIKDYFGDVKKEMMRTDVIRSKVRLDGRAYDEIRPICIDTSALPRSHGSSIFTRGETQAIVSVTLGTRDDELRIDSIRGDSFERFMLHYNFPPFSVGEARPLRGTSRREIGHGTLAERALKKVMPTGEDFPYTVRIVSEITESNGSSSMASVCGGSLALWDAGITTSAPVSGIAMGLIKEGDDVAILSDILGDEDHLGDMDFKVCGTKNGITAIQMDIKISGLSREIMTNALEQARAGREHILGKMNEALPEARAEMNEFAPRITQVRIHPDKIRDVIGPGGKIIRDIIAKSGAKVDVTDDGIVTIAAVGAESARKAKQMVEDVTREPEVNRVYEGLIKGIKDFGAFVEIFPGTEGLCHISELENRRVENVGDVVKEGESMKVVVLNVDRDGKIRLSRKRAFEAEVGTFMN